MDVVVGLIEFLNKLINGLSALVIGVYMPILNLDLVAGRCGLRGFCAGL